MCGRVGVELEGRGQGVEHLRGRAPVDSLLEPGQVLHRDAGQTGQLVAAQTGNPARTV